MLLRGKNFLIIVTGIIILAVALISFDASTYRYTFNTPIIQLNDYLSAADFKCDSINAVQLAEMLSSGWSQSGAVAEQSYDMYKSTYGNFDKTISIQQLSISLSYGAKIAIYAIECSMLEDIIDLNNSSYIDHYDMVQVSNDRMLFSGNDSIAPGSHPVTSFNFVENGKLREIAAPTDLSFEIRENLIIWSIYSSSIDLQIVENFLDICGDYFFNN